MSIPECVIDLDCGRSGYSPVDCRGDFIVRYYLNYSCSGKGAYDAKCEKTTSIEFIGWCNIAYGEACIEGYSTCQPKVSCEDNIRNCHDGSCEDGLDCGGPCEPCPSCSNNIMDCHDGKCEEGVDCGGPCPSCEIGCASDADCGPNRTSELYCGPGGDIYRDHFTYKCERPGLYGSWCKPIRIKSELVDYCGPYTTCVMGECWDRTVVFQSREWYCVSGYCCSRQPGKYCNPYPQRFYML